MSAKRRLAVSVGGLWFCSEENIFQSKVNDELGTILFPVRHFATLQNQKFCIQICGLVVPGEKNSAMLFIRNAFSTEVIFQLAKPDVN